MLHLYQHVLGHIVVFEAVDLASVEVPRASVEYLTLRRNPPRVRAPVYNQGVYKGGEGMPRMVGGGGRRSLQADRETVAK